MKLQMRCTGSIYHYGDPVGSKKYVISRDTLMGMVDEDKKYPVLDDSITAIDPDNPESVIGSATMKFYEDDLVAHIAISDETMKNNLLNDYNSEFKLTCALSDVKVNQDTNEIISGKLVSVAISKDFKGWCIPH